MIPVRSVSHGPHLFIAQGTPSRRALCIAPSKKLAIQAPAPIVTGVFGRSSGLLFLIGVLFVGFPDGAEVINLTASVPMAIALVRYGVKMVAAEQRTSG